MNKFFFVILALIIVSCGQKAETTADTAGVETIISETIPSEEFQQKMLTSENVIILDVRTPEELAGGYIEGAINIDFRASDFQTKISVLDREATYLVYCAGGGRSGDAIELMKDLKFKEAYNLGGGITDWSAKGLPVVRP